MATFGVLYLIAIIFLFVLAILWCVLPFAVFGTKPKIDLLIAEARLTNELLMEVRDLLKRVG